MTAWNAPRLASLSQFGVFALDKTYLFNQPISINRSKRSGLQTQHAGRKDFRLDLDSGRWLIGEVELQLMQEKLLFRGGLCVAWHDQPSSVSSWKRNVKHLHGSKRLQHCPGRQSGSQRLQPVFQRHQQTVSEERHQDVC